MTMHDRPGRPAIRTPGNGALRPHHRLQEFDYTSTDHAYFVTVCASRPHAPFANPLMAQVVVDSLYWLRKEGRIVLYAFCLMPDHLHLLLSLKLPGTSLGTIIGQMKTYTTRASWVLGHSGTLWQARSYDHVVRRSDDGTRMAQYILDNPVRAGLVEGCSAYPWCGIVDPIA